MDRNLDEIRELWEKETDNYLVKAATVDFETYPPAIQSVIKEEVRRRCLEGVEFSKPSIVKETAQNVIGEVFDPKKEGYVARCGYLSKAMLPIIVLLEKTCGALGVLLSEGIKRMFYKYQDPPQDIVCRKNRQ